MNPFAFMVVAALLSAVLALTFRAGTSPRSHRRNERAQLLLRAGGPKARLAKAPAISTGKYAALSYEGRSADAARDCVFQANDVDDAHCFETVIGVFKRDRFLRVLLSSKWQDVPYSTIFRVIDRVRDKPRCGLRGKTSLPIESARVYGQTRIYVAGEGVSLRLLDPAGGLFDVGNFLKEHVHGEEIQWNSDELDHLTYIAPDATTQCGDLQAGTQGDYLDRYLRRTKSRDEARRQLAKAKKSWDGWANPTAETPTKIQDFLKSREFGYPLDSEFHDIKDQDGIDVGSIGVTVGIAKKLINNVLLGAIPAECAAVSFLEEFDRMTWKHMISGKYDSKTIEKYLLVGKQVILRVDPQSRCRYW